jgi:hypothetical protein
MRNAGGAHAPQRMRLSDFSMAASLPIVATNSGA